LATAREAHLDNARAGVLAAQRVDARNTRTILMLGREIHGDVETMLDPRDALLLGLGLGVAVGAVSVLMRLFRPRSRPSRRS
jgi:hypothetical protein